MKSVRDKRREDAVELMADCLLKHGMAGASLRLLAEAAGTSDRMLLYYFEDKDDLLAATLEKVASRLRALLAAALPPGAKLKPAMMLELLWSAFRTPQISAYLRLWVELAAGAARDRQPDVEIAGRIIDGFMSWGSLHLDVESKDELEATAVSLMALLQGKLLLDVVGRRSLADAAQLLGAGND